MSYDLIAITGVTRGLGSVLTEWLIGQGKTIAGCARSQNGVDALNERFGDPHSFQAFDVTARDQVNDWAENVILPSILFTPLSYPVSVTRPPADVFRQLYTSIERTKDFAGYCTPMVY